MFVNKDILDIIATINYLPVHEKISLRGNEANLSVHRFLNHFYTNLQHLTMILKLSKNVNAVKQN